MSVPFTQFLTELIFQLPRWFRSDSGPLSQGKARWSHSRIFLALKIYGEHDDQLKIYGDTLKRIGYSSAMKNEMEMMMTNSQIWGCSTGPLCLVVSWAVIFAFLGKWHQATISGHPRSRVSLVKLDIRHLAPKAGNTSPVFDGFSHQPPWFLVDFTRGSSHKDG